MAEQYWGSREVEPKRQFKWRLELAGVPFFVFKSVNKPKGEVTEIEIPYMDWYFYYPARLKWSKLECELIDSFDTEGVFQLFSKIRDSGYVEPTSPDITQGMSRRDAISSLGDVSIIQMRADGSDGERWTLVNAWVSDFEAGELNFENEEVVTGKFSIRFDYATNSQS